MHNDLESVYMLYHNLYDLSVSDSIWPARVWSNSERAQVMRDARAWVESDAVYMFSFRDCCDMLDLDPKVERERIRAKWDRDPPAPVRQSPPGTGAEKLVRALQTRGSMTRSDLMVMINCTAEELDDILRSVSDIVEYVDEPAINRRTGKPYGSRTVRMYRLKGEHHAD